MRQPKAKRAILMQLSPQTDIVIAGRGTTILIRGTTSFTLSDAEASKLDVARAHFLAENPSSDQT